MLTPTNEQLRSGINVLLHLLEPRLAGLEIFVPEDGLLNAAQCCAQKGDQSSNLWPVWSGVGDDEDSHLRAHSVTQEAYRKPS